MDRTGREFYCVDYREVRHNPLTHDTLRSALQQAKPERWENLMGTIAETWIEQGKAVGITEGKAEAFLRLAQLKFGEVPQQRINTFCFFAAQHFQF